MLLDYDIEAANKLLQESLGNIEVYYDALNKIAGGNRDFVLKWIQKEFEIAMGNNDSERAAFMAKVANADEERMGRIPFDYELKTAREIQDWQMGLDALERARRRVEEDYMTARAGKEIEWGEARQGQNEGLISQGLLKGTREVQLTAGGIASQRMQKLEGAIQLEKEAQDTQQARSLEDIEKEREAGEIAHSRKLEDIQTEARRNAVDTIYQKEYGSEKAEHDYQTQSKQSEINKEMDKSQVNQLGQQMAA